MTSLGLVLLLAAAGPQSPELELTASEPLYTLVLDGLRAELPELRVVSGPAFVRARIEPQQDRLTLFVTRTGAPEDVRPLGARVHAEAAARRAIVILGQVLEQDARARSVEGAAVPASGGPALRTELSFGATTWSEPWTPQLGASVVGLIDVGRLEVGLRATGVGLCCRATSSALTVTYAAAFLTAELRYLVETGSPVAVEGFVGAGLAWEQVTGQVERSLSGTSPEERLDGLGFTAQVGGGLIWRFVDRLALVLQVGVQAHGRPLEVEFPDDLQPAPAAVRRGQLVPWGAAGLRVELTGTRAKER